MLNDFEIKNGTLLKYHGTNADVVIPNEVIEIGDSAFEKCTSLVTVTISDRVTQVGQNAFFKCINLKSINILSDGLQMIGDSAFQGCTSLRYVELSKNLLVIGDAAFRGTGLISISIPEKVIQFGRYLFADCKCLTSVTIPYGITAIPSSMFENCTSLESISIPWSVVKIGYDSFSGCTKLNDINFSHNLITIGWNAFRKCENLSSISIPDNVKEIERGAFSYCSRLKSVTLPNNLKIINSDLFIGCSVLVSITIPDSVIEIGNDAFSQCTSLSYIYIPDSVKKIGFFSFLNCHMVTIICRERSYTHRYCEEKHIAFIFDYQYEAFNGIIPSGIEKHQSPFHSDEDRPYVFVSYSHKDRDMVFSIIKILYEYGWKIWYDEGLTIGEKYDETLEEHVKNCTAFLLFETENSTQSKYINYNEIPWAKNYKKPIIKYVLSNVTNYEIMKNNRFAFRAASKIESKFKYIDGLCKGDSREAKGISVVVDPESRERVIDFFVYCIYSEISSLKAKTILLEARKGGCEIYDSVERGADAKKMNDCSVLLVFLDKAIMSEKTIVEMVVDEYKAGKDIAVCRIEEVNEFDFPKELIELKRKHWLNYVDGSVSDLNKMLMQYLQIKGCRDKSIIPGFVYEKTDDGIVLIRYTGNEADLRIEREYSGIPIIGIAKEAFMNNKNLHTITIPDSVTTIGSSAFYGCTCLTEINIPKNVRHIEFETFCDCISLRSIHIFDNVTMIDDSAFFNTGLYNNRSNWRNGALYIGNHLIKVNTKKNGRFSLKLGTRSIARDAFHGCCYLTSVIINSGVCSIPDYSFFECFNLNHIYLPDSVVEIGKDAFSGRESLGKNPGEATYSFNCLPLTIICKPGSYAEEYAKKNKFPFIII